MGKSQETFGKKEREKKKRQKKEAKARRREERKENSSDGPEIAYTDEYGNFHDTPPEPAKKVKAKDIVLGVPKKEETVEEDTIRQGVVTNFNHSKGFGFIRDKSTNNSVFVHINSCTEEIVENNMVSFEVEKTPKGLSAVNVKVIR